MAEYKKGDKVVYEQVLGKLEDFMSAQEKIKMTVEEKKEFDELRKDFIDNSRTVYAIMLIMFEEGRYPLIVMNCGGDFNEQLKLLECLKHPELIEVVQEDVRMVEVAELHLFKSEDEKAIPFLTDSLDIYNDGYYFTKLEIEEINKLDKFKHVNLVSAWEEA